MRKIKKAIKKGTREMMDKFIKNLWNWYMYAVFWVVIGFVVGKYF